MTARFSFRVDAARDLVRITLAGFFTPADVAAFLAAREEAHKALTCGPNQHVTLADMRGMNIQPQDAVAAFQRMLAGKAYRSRRLAFVIAPSLARLQLMRAISGRDARLFADEAEAEAWLLSPEADEEREAAA